MKPLLSNNLCKLYSQTAWWSTFFCVTWYILIHYEQSLWAWAGVAEVSGTESSDNEVVDDDDDVSESANSLQQPLLRPTDPHDGNHLSKQARRALKHLHAVDSNVRTVVSAVESSRTLHHSARSRVTMHPRRQESVPLWTRIRWWAIVIGTTFIVLPLIFILYVKLISSGS